MNSNNQMIQKGKISSVEGKADRNGDKTTARVLPSTADSMVTRPLTIPWYLRGEMGNLTPGTEVAYAMFEDGTGIILSRMDGEWGGIVPGDITVKFLSTPSARRATAKTETKALFSNKLYNILHEFRRALIYNWSKNYPNRAK